DLISSVRLSHLQVVESVFVFSNRIVLTHSNTADSVKRHVARLRKQRVQQNEDSIAKLYDERIKSLSPNHVVMRLANDKNFVQNSQSVDYVLRAFSAMLRHGIVEGETKQLAATLASSQVYTVKCIQAVNDLGAVVTSEVPAYQAK